MTLRCIMLLKEASILERATLLRHKDPCWSGVGEGNWLQRKWEHFGGWWKFGGQLWVVVIHLCNVRFHRVVHLKMDNFTICELYVNRPDFYMFFSVFGNNLLSVCSSLQLNKQLVDPWDEWFYLASVLTLEIYAFFSYVWQVNCHEVPLYPSSSFCHLPHSSILPVSQLLFA